MSERISGTEVTVRQPPPRPAPMSRALRKELSKARKEHRAVMKAARGRVANQRVFQRMANAGAAEHRGNMAWDKKRARASRKEQRFQQRVGRSLKKIDKAALKEAKNAIRSARARISSAKKAMRLARKKKTPGVRMRQHRQVRSQMAKAANLLWMWRKLKKALTPRRSDFRNHGFKNSGRGGLTGRAGFPRR